MTRIRLFLFGYDIGAFSLRRQRSMKFRGRRHAGRGRACRLRTSDDGCRGRQSRRATRLKECPGPQPGRGREQGRLSLRPSAPSSSALPRALPACKAVQLGIEPPVRRASGRIP